MSFLSLQTDIADIIEEFGSSGTISSKVQSAGSEPGDPIIVTTAEAVKYIIDSERKFSDPNYEMHPDDLFVLIPGTVASIPDTNDVFTTTDSRQWSIRQVEPIELTDIKLAYRLQLQGTQ